MKEFVLYIVCLWCLATKVKYIDDAVGALDIHLADEDVAYLEEMYVPHPVIGAIDKNPEQGVMLLDEKKWKEHRLHDIHFEQ